MRLGTVAFKHADQIRLFPRRPPGSLVLLVYGESEAAMAAGKGKADGTGVPGRGGDGAEDQDVTLLPLAERLDEITGVGAVNGRAIIAELGTGPSQFPAPGHAAGWARLTPAAISPGKQPGPAAPARATGTCAARSGRPR